MRSVIDLTGRTFGRLTVIEQGESRVSPSGQHFVRWVCRCACGNTTLSDGTGLRRGMARSCGCLRTEKATERLNAAREQFKPRRPRTETAGYGGAHERIRQDRGRASYHPCVDCSAPAAHWSYDHTDPDEKTDGRGYVYSLKPEHYSPRCVSCHKTFDLSREAAHV